MVELFVEEVEWEIAVHLAYLCRERGVVPALRTK